MFGGTIPNGRIVKIEGNKATKFVDRRAESRARAAARDDGARQDIVAS